MQTTDPATAQVGPAAGQATAPAAQATAAPAPGQGFYAQRQPNGQVVYYAQQPGAYVPPATSQQQPQKKRKRGPLFWFLIALAIAALVAAGLIAFMLLSDGPGKRQGSVGQLEGKTPEQIQAELDRVVDEGMFNISIASTVSFPSGTSPGELCIENVPANHYLMRVTISRNDTGQQIYETDLIEPNYHIQEDTLDVDLPPGNYECTAMFSAYDPETEDPIGQAGAEMMVVVES